MSQAPGWSDSPRGYRSRLSASGLSLSGSVCLSNLGRRPVITGVGPSPSVCFADRLRRPSNPCRTTLPMATPPCVPKCRSALPTPGRTTPSSYTVAPGTKNRSPLGGLTRDSLASRASPSPRAGPCVASVVRLGVCLSGGSSCALAGSLRFNIVLRPVFAPSGRVDLGVGDDSRHDSRA